DFIDGYTPADGDSFTVIEYTSRSGTFDTITYSGAFDLIASYGASALTLTVDYGDSATTVPEPSTLALLVGIGCCLGLFWRKRR
ncbi:MAG: PEP-CTERM sorting domain-containing protein, partial [Planctomycetia bacterium]